MDELKPCPFCGGEAHFVNVPNGLMVRCCQCGAKSETVHNRLINHYQKKDVPSKIFFERTYKEASDLWNRRADNG